MKVEVLSAVTLAGAQRRAIAVEPRLRRRLVAC